jgi:hypothetical protein
MPPPTRQFFQQQLDAVEEELQNHARLVMRALDRAMQVLLAGVDPNPARDSRVRLP